MVLDDHVRRKRRLLPPLLAEFGDSFVPYSWARQIAPELIWIGLLLDRFGPEPGLEVARQIGSAASEASNADPKPVFAPFSSFLELGDDEKEAASDLLQGSTLDRARDALAPLSAIWPGHPLAFLSSGRRLQEREDALQRLAPIIEGMYDPRDRGATLAIATAVYVGLEQGRIPVAESVYERARTAFEDVGDYPATDASRAAGSFFRASAGVFLLRNEAERKAVSETWIESFWDELPAIGGCSGGHQALPELPDVTGGFAGFVNAFSHAVHQDVRARQEAWELDFDNAQEQSVGLALLARQATLAIEIASSPGTWNPNVAPVLLRAMADAHITLAWLLGDPTSRVPLYVEAGLAAVELEIAHRKEEQQKDSTTDESYEAYTKCLENWLESQRLEFLAETNPESWSNKNTREMAQESGTIDFYNYVFQPFSAAVHSYWSHVGRINVEYCRNPTHNFHFLPVIPSFPSDEHWCRLAANYLAKSLDVIDRYLGRSDIPTESYAVVVAAFDRQEENASDSAFPRQT